MSDEEPLPAAVAANDLAMVADLLLGGADPNAKDEWGRPVLYFAIDPDVDLAILRHLLVHGASLAAAHWSGEPLLHAAAREKAAAKEAKAAAPKAPRKSSGKKAAAPSGRVCIVWSVCDSSGKEVQQFPYAQEQEARA